MHQGAYYVTAVDHYLLEVGTPINSAPIYAVWNSKNSTTQFSRVIEYHPNHSTAYWFISLTNNITVNTFSNQLSLPRIFGAKEKKTKIKQKGKMRLELFLLVNNVASSTKRILSHSSAESLVWNVPSMPSAAKELRACQLSGTTAPLTIPAGFNYYHTSYFTLNYLQLRVLCTVKNLRPYSTVFPFLWRCTVFLEKSNLSECTKYFARSIYTRQPRGDLTLNWRRPR